MRRLWVRNLILRLNKSASSWRFQYFRRGCQSRVREALVNQERALHNLMMLGAIAHASQLGLVEQTLRNWVKLSAAGKLTGAGTKPVTQEQMDLSRLRAENVRLKRECEILKKATAYFARDVV